MIILLLFTFLLNVNSYNICVVGSGGGLGRELVYQGLKDKNFEVLALTSKDIAVYEPFRGDSFNDIKKKNIIEDKKLRVGNYWNEIKEDYEHIIFCTGGGPFEKDYSDKLMKNIINNISPKCKSISLLSAYGVGDSLKESNLGIEIMNSWYLRDAYRAKNEQEKILNNFDKKIKKKIYRPKALSYGNTYLDSISRFDLANEILDNL